MPYIDPQNREILLAQTREPVNAGELNFLFTDLINRYLQNNGILYQSFNDVLGALEGAKLELYRRLIGPYENQKIEANGDAYLSSHVRKTNG